MAGKRNEVQYPMVDLLTGGMMPFVYLNILTAWHLLLLTAPWSFLEAWMKALKTERAP